MAGRVNIVYLDIDDEITSAAARIRAADEIRIALVLPSGSRIATSRINFRLLAREAQDRHRDLLVVAPEAATRALAASAGIEVYATVRELEQSIEAPDDPDRPSRPSDERETGPAARPAGAKTGRTRARRAGSPAPPDPALDTGSDGAATPGPVASVAPITSAPPARSAPPTSSVRAAADDHGSPGHADFTRPPGGRGAPANLPVVSAERRRGARRTGWLIVGAAVALVTVVGGVIGVTYLPVATIVVTPRVDPVGPLSFNVRADPAVTSPDATNAVVPASVSRFPLSTSGDYPATGKKATDTKAAGTVTFSNIDPFAQHRIAAGSIVSTSGGIDFTTTQVVILNPAQLVSKGGQIVIEPTTGDSPVTAVKAGTSGNVAAGAIDVPPSNQNPRKVRVRNNAGTSGGTHTETLVVSQKDITAATTDLARQLGEKLDAVLADPSQALPGTTVFPETKAMSAAVPSVDPTTLVGQAIASFSFGLSATGSVTAVDEKAVEDVSSQRLLGGVASDHTLVPNSLQVTVGSGRIEGSAILFPVRASAGQVRNLVAADLVAAIRGHTATEARTILGAYGDATVDLWPGFVDRVPTNDTRIDLTIKAAPAGSSPAPSGTDAGSSAGPSLTIPGGSEAASGSAAP